MKCVCCQRGVPAPTAHVDRGLIHFDCWTEHHSDPHSSHGCQVDAPLCPECEQGKHGNCTDWALDEDDNEVACGCRETAHG